MFGLFTLILALTVLYTLARIFIQKLFTLLYRFTGDKEKAAVLLGWIFMPGTFIHEASHLLVAIFLVVPFGKMNLIPEVTEDGVKLGSMQIGKTDFIRGSLIGLAPILAGGGIMFWLIFLSFTLGYIGNPWFVVLVIYLIFEITHTMFSSKRDLGAVLELVVFLAIIITSLLFLKIYEPFFYIFDKLIQISPIAQKLAYFLFVPIGLELIFLGLFRKARL